MKSNAFIANFAFRLPLAVMETVAFSSSYPLPPQPENLH